MRIVNILLEISKLQSQMPYEDFIDLTEAIHEQLDKGKPIFESFAIGCLNFGTKKAGVDYTREPIQLNTIQPQFTPPYNPTSDDDDKTVVVV